VSGGAGANDRRLERFGPARSQAEEACICESLNAFVVGIGAQRRRRHLDFRSGHAIHVQSISAIARSRSMPYCPRMRHQISRYATIASSRVEIRTSMPSSLTSVSYIRTSARRRLH
jgi:hypothetical protein